MSERTAERLTGTPGRLDAVVAEALGVARADVQRAIAKGTVTVDGVSRPKSYRLVGGEAIEVSLPGEEPLAHEGPAVPIVWQDKHLVVLSKPAGIVTHPTETHRTGSLVNRLLGMGVPLSELGGELRPGIVHRLDRGTSGLMIVASSDEAFEALSAMMRRHEVDRRYLALVRGVAANDRFAVDAPLGRRAARVIVDQVEGREAETSFEVLERLENATLLEAAPRTGRTHQIRVHLAAIGHPILGDREYGGRGDDARAINLQRPFLHSCRISFTHPITGETIEAEEPLPADLSEALEAARSR